MLYDISIDHITNALIYHNGWDIDEKQLKCLVDIFDDLSTHGYKITGETNDAKVTALEDKANKARIKLMEALADLGVVIGRKELFYELQKPIKVMRKESVYTKILEPFKEKLLDAGFTPTQIRDIYLPAIKRYIKEPSPTPFNTNFNKF